MSDGNGRELPEGWVWAKVGEVGEVRLGRQRSPKHHRGSHMRPYLRVANVFEDRIDTTDVKEMNFTPREYETYRLEHGDILLNEGQSLELVGRPAMYRDEVPGACFQNTLVRFRAKADLLNRKCALYYFLHCLHSGRFQEIATRTVNIAHLGAGRFAEMDFPLPPLSEQHRIVDKIEELFSDLDAGDAALEKTERLLERYRQSVLKAAVEGDLTREWREQNPDVEPADVLLERILEERRVRWEADQLAKYQAKGKKPPAGWKNRYKEPVEPDTSDLPELPEGWVWTSMEVVSWDSGYGTSAKCRYENSGPAVLRIPNLVDGKLDLGDMKFAADENATGNTAQLSENDLLIIRTNGSADLIGRVGLVDRAPTEPLYFASYLIRFRLCRALSSAWVRINWQAPDLRAQIIAEAASSAGQYNISLSAINAFSVPLPPLAEQEAIVEEVARRLSVVDAVSAEVNRQRSRVKQLRRVILQKAFEGKLVPQDPEDEPAEVVERIGAKKRGNVQIRKKWRGAEERASRSQ
jgi:type I restriction enzyme, S subunit